MWMIIYPYRYKAIEVEAGQCYRATKGVAKKDGIEIDVIDVADKSIIVDMLDKYGQTALYRIDKEHFKTVMIPRDGLVCVSKKLETDLWAAALERELSNIS